MSMLRTALIGVVLVTALLPAAAPVVYPAGTLRSTGGTWTNHSPLSSPSARFRHGMASAGGDQALLFGGNDGTIYFDDTWVYDLSAGTWTDMALVSARSGAEWTAPRPAPLDGSQSLAWLGENHVLLFGTDYCY